MRETYSKPPTNIHMRLYRKKEKFVPETDTFLLKTDMRNIESHVNGSCWEEEHELTSILNQINRLATGLKQRGY